MSRKMRVFVLLLFVLSFGLAACAAPVKNPEVVLVNLTEFGIQSSLTNFEVGQPYRFVITNSGALSHEFTVMPAGMPVPSQEMDGMHHDMAGAMLHVGENELQAGAVVTVEFTFTESAELGKLEFACHLPAHYEAGMFTPISIGA
jgi:uncharacterized cupredoxin-like copper-binding protein